MKVCAFITRLAQLNHYLSNFPLHSPGQPVEKILGYEVKRILFYTLPELCQKYMTEQGYNYIDTAVSVQNMADFFESRCENIEAEPEIKKAKKARSSLRNARMCSFRKILLRTRNPRVRGSTMLTMDTLVILQLLNFNGRVA